MSRFVQRFREEARPTEEVTRVIVTVHAKWIKSKLYTLTFRHFSSLSVYSMPTHRYIILIAANSQTPASKQTGKNGVGTGICGPRIFLGTEQEG